MSQAKLFTPFGVGALKLANRIVIAPMCQYSAEDGCMTDWHVIHLGHLALSGAALLTIEATAVERAGRITYAIAPQDAQCRRDGAPTRFGGTDFAPPATDHGTLLSLKWSFADCHNRLQPGGWARQTTGRELQIAQALNCVNMRLKAGAVREMHWHKPDEWGFPSWSRDFRHIPERGSRQELRRARKRLRQHHVADISALIARLDLDQPGCDLSGPSKVCALVLDA